MSFLTNCASARKRARGRHARTPLAELKKKGGRPFPTTLAKERDRERETDRTHHSQNGLRWSAEEGGDLLLMPLEGKKDRESMGGLWYVVARFDIFAPDCCDRVLAELDHLEAQPSLRCSRM